MRIVASECQEETSRAGLPAPDGATERGCVELATIVGEPQRTLDVGELAVGRTEYVREPDGQDGSQIVSVEPVPGICGSHDAHHLGEHRRDRKNRGASCS